MGPSIGVAQSLAKICCEARLLFYIHEDLHWQYSIRVFNWVPDRGSVGTSFRARLTMVTDYPIVRERVGAEGYGGVCHPCVFDYWDGRV
jgi:hypothetical protein